LSREILALSKFKREGLGGSYFREGSAKKISKNFFVKEVS
jgi:hypothetical protein